jgi:hypothetical protein
MEIAPMKRTKLVGVLRTATALVFLLTGCDIALPGTGGTSDVPCFRPTAWPNESGEIAVRMDRPDSMLLAHLTSDQVVEDIGDLITGNDGHGPVYRFNATAKTFELVDDAVWDAATGMAIGCTGQEARDSPFVLERMGGNRMLFFEGRQVAVAGGFAASIWDPREKGGVVAVISASGGGSIPLISNLSSSGQHYHQLFSEIDGEPIGDPLRLPFSGAPNPPDGCWSPDNSFVLYSEASDGRFNRICVVDVRDLLPQPEPEDGGLPEDQAESPDGQP